MEIYLATRMTSVVYIFMYILLPRGCIIIWYRIRVRNATRSRVAANDDGLRLKGLGLLKFRLNLQLSLLLLQFLSRIRKDKYMLGLFLFLGIHLLQVFNLLKM